MTIKGSYKDYLLYKTCERLWATMKDYEWLSETNRDWKTMGDYAWEAASDYQRLWKTILETTSDYHRLLYIDYERLWMTTRVCRLQELDYIRNNTLV